jgi:type II secretory ATPase GspE/PulE/Tfp pilus assembly ATPase PilB-like protein
MFLTFLSTSNATALEALKAGLNGHRVLATLHASSIKEAISRLWAFLITSI